MTTAVPPGGDIWDRVREIVSKITGLDPAILDQSHWLTDLAQDDTRRKRIIDFLEEDFQVKFPKKLSAGSCSLNEIVNAIADLRNA